MNLIDRLIARAQEARLVCRDNVFIISNETGEWMVEGRRFPDSEAALEYVEGLMPDDSPECMVIINDLRPCDPEALAGLAAPYDWIDRIREENRERIRREREEEKRGRPPEKDRRLI